MGVAGVVNRRDGKVFYDLEFTNTSTSALGGVAIQVNKNFFGLAPAAPLQVGTIQAGGAARASVGMLHLADKLAPAPPGASPLLLQVALKNSAGVFYFKDLVPFDSILTQGGGMKSSEYPSRWQAMPPSNQAVSPLTGFPLTVAHVERALSESNIEVLHKKKLGSGGDALYCSCATLAGHVLLCEIQILPTAARCAVRSDTAGVSALLPPALQSILSS